MRPLLGGLFLAASGCAPMQVCGEQRVGGGTVTVTWETVDGPRVFAFAGSTDVSVDQPDGGWTTLGPTPDYAARVDGTWDAPLEGAPCGFDGAVAVLRLEWYELPDGTLTANQVGFWLINQNSRRQVSFYADGPTTIDRGDDLISGTVVSEGQLSRSNADECVLEGLGVGPSTLRVEWDFDPTTVYDALYATRNNDCYPYGTYGTYGTHPTYTTTTYTTTYSRR